MKKTGTQAKKSPPRLGQIPPRQVYARLFAAWGPQHWWPGETDEEMAVGAILTQNTAWTNVEKAIRNLKRAQVLSLQAIRRLDARALAELIRPAGYFNVKARRLRALADLVANRFEGRLATMFALATPALRKELLSVNGIGPETADSILLYAARRPVFVVDAYTRRFLERHQWARPQATYDEVAALFTARMALDQKVYNEYHALIVKLGKDFCKKKAPRCAACPLYSWLPGERCP